MLAVKVQGSGITAVYLAILITAGILQPVLMPKPVPDILKRCNMPQFEVTDSIIKNHASNSDTFHKGFIYYLNKRVLGFEFDEDNLTAHAIVQGHEKYSVAVSFSERGTVKSSRCSCPAYSTYSGACKHIVAVLKTAQKELKDLQLSPVQNQKAVNQIFSYFGSMDEESKKETIRLELTYNLEKDYNRVFSSVELRIGKDRLYVVKSLKDFFDSLDNYKTMEFGKNFMYDPSIHTFSKQDQAIINLFKEIQENEKLLKNSFSNYYQSGSVFKGKKIYLSDHTVKRLFYEMKGKPFNAVIFDVEASGINILMKELPLDFSLKPEKENLLLTLNIKQTVIPITKAGEYFYYNGSIYNPPEQQQKYFLPFYSGFSNSLKKCIVFTAQEKGRFVSEILPYVQSIGQVWIDEELQKSFYREELQVRIYFDKYLDGISAKPEFHYGEVAINPFAARQTASEISGRILVREMEKERNILAFFEKADFKVEKDRIYLLDEDRMFEFMYQVFPRLQEQAEIYYSDSFRSIKIKEPSTFSGGVRLNQRSNMLEFSFHYEDIDNNELSQIFASLREKKKYYRLRDGSFIPLNAPELESMAELVDQLNIDGDDLGKKAIELPKYRAMYIDSILRESRLHHVERNLAFKQMVQNIREPEDMEFEIPPSLQNVLRDYQKIGFKWLNTLAAYGFGGILADDMGLGKTLQVIAFVLAEKAKGSGPSLVIAPTSLIYNWQDEVRKFTHQLNVLVISGVQKERQEQLQEISSADIVVTSYPLIRRDVDMYSEYNFACCFLDEAQHIKNPNTINARSVKQIKANSYFALTGTPIENSLTELWSIFDFIMPGYLSSHARFVRKYENPVVKNQDKKALTELSRHIRPFILRRMKKDVLKELPEKIETRMTAEMTGEQKKIYLAYLQQARGEIAREIEANGFEKSQIKILAALTRLRQICCHPSLFVENYAGDSGKISLLEEVLEDAIESGHRILLFSQFTSMLEIIKTLLNEKKTGYFYLDGSTKAEDRVEMVRTFNNGEGKVFLISLKAGGTGLNLTGADMVIHYDPWWNPAVEDQASDRAHRIGQKNVVQVIKLITQGTIEEKIFELQQKKKEIIDSVIKPGETLLTKMTENDIKELFEM